MSILDDVDDGTEAIIEVEGGIMDDPNITMEEYIKLQEEKAQRAGRTFNWQTATYGKVKYYEDEDNCFTNFESEFPAIVFDDTSDAALSCKPTDNDIDEIDIEQSSRDMSVIPLPNVINTDDGAYALRSNKLLETSHDTSNVTPPKSGRNGKKPQPRRGWSVPIDLSITLAYTQQGSIPGDEDLRNGYHIQGRQQARANYPIPDYGETNNCEKPFAKDVFSNQERKWGAYPPKDDQIPSLVSTINDADQGSADVAYRTPLAPSEKSSFGFRGDIRKAETKELTEGHHQVEPALNLAQHGNLPVQT
ncbi:hypothetical protein Tco_0084550 [Tanacetum coccineum]